MKKLAVFVLAFVLASLAWPPEKNSDGYKKETSKELCR